MSLHSNHGTLLQLALFVPIATHIAKRLELSNPQILTVVIVQLEKPGGRRTSSWFYILKAMVRRIMRCNWFVMKAKICLIAICVCLQLFRHHMLFSWEQINTKVS